MVSLEGANSLEKQRLQATGLAADFSWVRNKVWGVEGGGNGQRR